ncbi:MLO-like protein [Forsythia ovata]|uniref:MLO-like protein n=1 Tax=Forsythia ovata TaxID=205694 RepID=A0ABD1SME9_9LAMI
MTPPPCISSSPHSSPHPPAGQQLSTYFESISLDSFVSFSVFNQVLCSYSTLPFYAIVTQMGSHFKKSIFDEHVQVGLVGWAQKVKNKKGLKVASGASAAQGNSTQDDSTQGSSTLGGIHMAGIGRKETTPAEALPAINS